MYDSQEEEEADGDDEILPNHERHGSHASPKTIMHHSSQKR